MYGVIPWAAGTMVSAARVRGTLRGAAVLVAEGCSVHWYTLVPVRQGPHWARLPPSASVRWRLHLHHLAWVPVHFRASTLTLLVISTHTLFTSHASAPMQWWSEWLSTRTRAHAVVVNACLRACSGGKRVRASLHVQWQSPRVSTRKRCSSMVFIAGNTIYRVRVRYRARLRACSGSQRMLTRMQWHSTHTYTHAVILNAGLHACSVSQRAPVRAHAMVANACLRVCSCSGSHRVIVRACGVQRRQ